MAFRDLGNILRSGGQTVSSGAKNMKEVIVRNAQIQEASKNINSLYLEIGKQYFNKHASDMGAEFGALMRQIMKEQEKIDRLNEEIKQIRGVVKCPSCGEDNSLDALFCCNCGNPIKQSRPVTSVSDDALPQTDEESPEIAEVPETPEEPEETQDVVMTEAEEEPEEEAAQEVPEEPEEPEEPEAPETPEEPEDPEDPEEPEEPEEPETPEVPEYAEAEPRSGQFKICPNCKKEIGNEFMFCPDCGTMLM